MGNSRKLVFHKFMVYLGISSGSIVCTCVHAHSYMNNLQSVFMEVRGQHMGTGGVVFLNQGSLWPHLALRSMYLRMTLNSGTFCFYLYF